MQVVIKRFLNRETAKLGTAVEVQFEIEQWQCWPRLGTPALVATSLPEGWVHGFAQMAAVASLLAASAATAAAASAFTLDLGPAQPVALQAFANSTLSSWGGNAAKSAGDGKWHLFAAAMTGGCNLGDWKTNSEVVHAVGDSPVGPFRFRDVVLPRWHHNPQLMVHPDGTWLLLTMSTVGAATEKSCRHMPLSARSSVTAPHAEPTFDVRSAAASNSSSAIWNCSVAGRGYCDSGGTACTRPPGCRVCCGEFVQLHHAPGPDGPWTFLNSSQNLSIPGLFAGTNPTPVVCGTPSTGPCGKFPNVSPLFFLATRNAS